MWTPRDTGALLPAPGDKPGVGIQNADGGARTEAMGVAGDWIKMRTNLSTNPKVIGIADRVGVPVPQVIGCLFMLWSWANEHTVDGNAAAVSVRWLDRYVGVEGFAQALQDVDWLSVDDAATGRGLRLPRFDAHCSQTAKQRALTSRRVGVHHARKANAQLTPTLTPQLTATPLPREDKRREEEKDQNPPSPPSGGTSGRAARPVRKTLADVQIPDRLALPPFVAAWGKWVEHQSQRPHGNRQTPAGAESWLAKIVKDGWTIDRAVAAIELSMQRGWRAVYEGERGGIAAAAGVGDSRPHPAAAASSAGLDMVLKRGTR